jgi:hypothetical protein
MVQNIQGFFSATKKIKTKDMIEALGHEKHLSLANVK